MASNEKRFVGYIKMKTRNHFNIKFRNEDSRYYNGFRATDLKLYKKPAKKSAKKSVKKKVTLEKWLKDTRPTIAKMTDNDWYKLEADDDHDWMSRYKLPFPPLE
jgi:hypothetical protein